MRTSLTAVLRNSPVRNLARSFAARNYATLAIAEGVSKVLTFLAIAYLARVVGPANYGLVEFAASVLLVAGLIVDQGFGPYGAREIARNPQRTRELVAEITGARILLAVVAYALVLACAVLLSTTAGRSPDVRSLLALYGLSLFALPFLLQWVFQGHELMRPVAVMQVIRQAAYALVIFAFLRNGADLRVAAFAEIAGVGAAALVGLVMFRRRFGNLPRPTLRFSRQLLTQGVPIGLSQMFWTLRMFGATVLLGLFTQGPDLGYFAAAMRLLIAAHTFVWLYYFNLLPSLSRAWLAADGSFAALVRRSSRITNWVGLAVLVVWAVGAQFVATAIYGASYTDVAGPLRWTAAVWFLALFSGHYRFGLIAGGRPELEMWSTGLGALAALMGIPIGYRLAGIDGAAVALVLAEAVVLLASRAWATSRLALRQTSDE